ncbi:hypothetical protein OG401_23355 [Kitasatospora purpeofusca]|uniref:DUF7848 domain-containing protein n=1 Tax=Kitasatospora purpeofusca TaxID=67352 RepID=UPI00224FA9ED|nr:hypothetical protein [Kitasatospora purpeofusca]MCX4687205.1 hypothetical protein [Kitasatospora purpeofusca]
MALGTPSRDIGIRRLFRFIEWFVGSDPDRAQIHLVSCEGEDEDGTRCRADSGEQSDREAAELWMFEHVAERPDHRSYGRLSYHPMITVPREEPT